MWPITDGSDLEGVTEVRDIKYMKLLRASLNFIRAWPAHKVGDQVSKFAAVLRWYMLVLEAGCILPSYVYIKNNMGKITFFELGHNYITLLMNFVAVSRVLLIFTDNYHQLVADFVLEMHVFHFRLKSAYAMEINMRVHKISHFLTVYILGMCVLGVSTFNVIPLYINYRTGAFVRENLGNVTLEPSVYFSFPFDSTTNYTGYWVVFFFNWYIAYVCSTYFCTIDCLLSLLVVHIWGHLKILCHSLHNFNVSKDMDDPSKLTFTEEENRAAYSELRNIIIHHQKLLDFLKKTADSFGGVLLFYYGFHQLSGCLLLLLCSQLNTEALVKYGALTIILFQQLIQLSVIFELLGTMGERLADAAYSVPWELMSVPNRKIVHIMLKQTNLSLNVKALDILEIGQRTMVAILKTTFTYFVMLRTVAIEN